MHPTISHSTKQCHKVQKTFRNKCLVKHATLISKAKVSYNWILGIGKQQHPGSLQSHIKIKHRCRLTGRPRSIRKTYGYSRQLLRKLTMLGQISGLHRNLW